MVSVQEHMVPTWRPKSHTPTIVKCVAWLAIGVGVWQLGSVFFEMVLDYVRRTDWAEFKESLFSIPFILVIWLAIGAPGAFCVYFGWRSLTNVRPSDVRGAIAAMLVLLGVWMHHAMPDMGMSSNSAEMLYFELNLIAITLVLIPVHFYLFRVVSVVANFPLVDWRNFASKPIILLLSIEMYLVLQSFLHPIIQIDLTERVSTAPSFLWSIAGLSASLLQYAIPIICYRRAVKAMTATRQQDQGVETA